MADRSGSARVSKLQLYRGDYLATTLSEANEGALFATADTGNSDLVAVLQEHPLLAVVEPYADLPILTLLK